MYFHVIIVLLGVLGAQLPHSCSTAKCGNSLLSYLRVYARWYQDKFLYATA